MGTDLVQCGVVWYGVPKALLRNGNGQDALHTGIAKRGCSVVWYGVAWCGVVWCGVVWCGVVWCGVVWYSVVWCGVPKALLPNGIGWDVLHTVKCKMGVLCVVCCAPEEGGQSPFASVVLNSGLP